MECAAFGIVAVLGLTGLMGLAMYFSTQMLAVEIRRSRTIEAKLYRQAYSKAVELVMSNKRLDSNNTSVLERQKVVTDMNQRLDADRNDLNGLPGNPFVG